MNELVTMKLWHSFEELPHVVVEVSEKTKVRVDTYHVQNDVTIRLNRSIERNISGPTTNIRWSPSKTRTSCLMIIGESSNVLIWPLHAPNWNFIVIRITNN